MSLFDYAGMLFGSARIAQFQSAITAAVRPGDRVLEIGTGLGTYAFFAARAGASAVTAVESDSVIHIAQALASANDLAERIRFVHGKAPGEIPQETFDVIIFEDFPTNFLDNSTFRLLKALEDDHLVAGGRFLPGSARLCLAPVLTSVDSVDSTGWGHSAFGVDWSELRELLANTGRKSFLTTSVLAAQAHVGHPFPILPVPTMPDLRTVAAWDGVTGEIGGLALWFDLGLGNGHWVSNAPKERSEPWGQWFFPLDPPLQVDGSSSLEAHVWWEELEDGTPGWMGWECRWKGEARRGHEFAGLPIGSADLGLENGLSQP